MDKQGHWDRVYGTKGPDQVSWYRPHLERSLELIEHAVAGRRDAAIVDVGGGASTLVDDLVARGYQRVTVLDLSQAALDVARARVGAAPVRWVQADVTSYAFEAGEFDVWHDRAVFHFLTSAEERVAYVRAVSRSVRPNGHVIVSTFGPEGPTKCSGLDVVRYDDASLHAEFGAEFTLLESLQEIHETPWGSTQQFVYCRCRRS